MADQSRHRQSTESYGLGQSGYTAGRRAGDCALERNIEGRNRGYPRGLDERVLYRGDDERWTGGGGSQWEPETEHTPTFNEQAADAEKADHSAVTDHHPVEAERRATG